MNKRRRTVSLLFWIACLVIVRQLWDPIPKDDITDRFKVGKLPWMSSEIKSYAGLLPIRNVSQMFFWYFPKASDKLIIWLQGGPGSSSMIGLFYEMGPIQIRQGMLAWNPDSWDGSMLFIDNPVGTGFSFVNGSIEIARRNVTSLEELERRAANLPSDCVPQDTTVV